MRRPTPRRDHFWAASAFARAILVLALVAGGAHRAVAQVSLDAPPLAESDAKRLDRMEKAMKELRAIVFQGRETGAPVVVQPADTEANFQRLSDRLGDLEQSLAKLNGELEVTRHDGDLSRQGVGDLRATLAGMKDEIATLEKAVQALSPPSPPPAPPPGDSGVAPPAAAPATDPAARFAAAQTALEQGDMATAEAGFRAFIAQNGDGPKGPEARYGLARALIARHDWQDAATADIGAIRGWPHTRWAPAAVLDLSRSLMALGKPQDACETLGELTRRYPNVAPAILRDARNLKVEAQCG
jgi:TolA-binding protein